MNTFQPSLASETARQTTTVLLIRHAETASMATTLAGRHGDIVLSAAGVRQAADLARELAAAPLTAVYSSPLRRARATADALAAHRNIEVAIEPDLIEIDFGEWTGLTFKELSRREDWRAYNAHRDCAGVPRGECPQAAADRIVRALARLHARHAGTVIAAVTHAELVRYAVLGARGLPLCDWAEVDVPPASITTLRFAGTRVLA
jgi:probable phosphoglycerate mutase